jgi:hypothetical protein
MQQMMDGLKEGTLLVDSYIWGCRKGASGLGAEGGIMSKSCGEKVCWDGVDVSPCKDKAERQGCWGLYSG